MSGNTTNADLIHPSRDHWSDPSKNRVPRINAAVKDLSKSWGLYESHIGFSGCPRQVCCIRPVKPMITTGVGVWEQAYPRVIAVKISRTKATIKAINITAFIMIATLKLKTSDTKWARLSMWFIIFHFSTLRWDLYLNGCLSNLIVPRFTNFQTEMCSILFTESIIIRSHPDIASLYFQVMQDSGDLRYPELARLKIHVGKTKFSNMTVW